MVRMGATKLLFSLPVLASLNGLKVKKCNEIFLKIGRHPRPLLDTPNINRREVKVKMIIGSEISQIYSLVIVH